MQLFALLLCQQARGRATGLREENGRDSGIAMGQWGPGREHRSKEVSVTLAVAAARSGYCMEAWRGRAGVGMPIATGS